MSHPGARRTLPPLIPPFRHCMVEDGLYRGAHPSLKNLRFMRRLKLRTILSLVPEPTGPSRDLREYCDEERIRLVWHHVDKYDDGFSHTPQLVASVLSELVDPRNHPLFLHCRDGSHNTGLVVMCLRRLQNWSLPTIYEEFMRYTKSNDISFLEKQFVESFHAKVTIPPVIPHWLWEGVRHGRHPSIQLELVKDPDSSSASALKSPATPELRESEMNGQLVSPGEESRQDSAAAHHRTFGQPRHKNIRTHYVTNLAALDLGGVHFARCCRPDIDGHVVSTARRRHRGQPRVAAAEQDPGGGERVAAAANDSDTKTEETDCLLDSRTEPLGAHGEDHRDLIQTRLPGDRSTREHGGTRKARKPPPPQ